jgi:hypothetical protein
MRFNSDFCPLSVALATVKFPKNEKQNTHKHWKELQFTSLLPLSHCQIPGETHVRLDYPSISAFLDCVHQRAHGHSRMQHPAFLVPALNGNPHGATREDQDSLLQARQPFHGIKKAGIPGQAPEPLAPGQLAQGQLGAAAVVVAEDLSQERADAVLERPQHLLAILQVDVQRIGDGTEGHGPRGQALGRCGDALGGEAAIVPGQQLASGLPADAQQRRDRRDGQRPFRQGVPVGRRGVRENAIIPPGRFQLQHARVERERVEPDLEA